MISYAPNGVEIIKEAIKKAEDVDKDIVIKYVGAGKYSIIVKAHDYKEAEKLLEKSTKKAGLFFSSGPKLFLNKTLILTKEK